MNVSAPITGRITFNRKKVTLFFLDHIIEMVLLAIIIGLTVDPYAKNFMTWSNWMNILRSNSLRGVIALGMTMVIISGQIDLSIGSTVALSGVIVAFSCRELPKLGVGLDLAAIIGIGISLLAAVLIGAFHGIFQYRAGMPAFIITLVSKNALYGLAAIISGGYPIANQYPDWFNFLGGGRIPMPGGLDGIPVAALVLIISFIIVFFIMNYTTTGRATYAAGGNPESARLSGINVAKTLIICYIAVQVFAVISGFMTSGQVLAGSYSFGFGWELDVISAVIIGGTSFSGGVGSVWGTLLGIIFMGVITNGLTLLNKDIYTQYVVKAAIMFFAVLISSYRAKAKA